MTNVLYIGNNLKSKTSNLSGIQVLGTLLEKEGFRMYYASSKTNQIFRLLDMVYSVIRLRKTTKFVLIDTYSTTNFYYALIISQLCRILNLKYIPILHGGNLENRLKYSPRLSKLIFNNAYKLVAPSHFLKSVFEKYGYNQIILIPNAIEINNYTFHDKNYDTPRLLWVRSFSKIYNPTLAIEVFNKIKETCPKSVLCMVGPDSDGTLNDVKQLASQLNLDVEFTGKLSKKEWIALSKNYNIFINTTNFDNTPVSVIEAMALGLPIVSTNVGGIPFLIENKKDGLLVPPNDVEAFMEAVMQIVDSPENSKMIASRARKKVEVFNWNSLKHLWIAVLS